ncbi:DUF397 domain-containing protein [Actinocorallia sp. A-T 12471]|uniref:DUF397 domain-containing protein n=1 Tax=Actinocorallia sp. A-T 12471 TaxID=3089813 RepID=UPI0029D1E8CD|nr:DUF397 domain-containing protein [Actinocorallia sp. A-T 12471]MDX6743445.1 DUF397 domain-containing protein [Actinocorallia sp. A-T 12471]
MELKFFKSSYSEGAHTDCVEAAFGEQERHFRDSKNPDGGTLSLSPAAYSAFIGALKAE